MRRIALIATGITAILLALAFPVFPLWLWLAGADHHIGGVDWDRLLGVEVLLLAVATLSFLLASGTRGSKGQRPS